MTNQHILHTSDAIETHKHTLKFNFTKKMYFTYDYMQITCNKSLHIIRYITLHHLIRFCFGEQIIKAAFL